MNPSELAERTEALLERLKALRGDVRKLGTKTVSRLELRRAAENLAKDWFGDVGPALRTVGVTDATALERYDENFRRLLRLSGPSNLKESYLEVVESVCKTFKEEVVLPLHTGAKRASTQWESFLDGLPDAESEYLSEALACARAGYLRAATVLGWCACIDALHRTVENLGFAKFNTTSAAIASQDRGRFKRFKKVFVISSISELRATVFDSDLLWILEGTGLIDANQHQRLQACFQMRNHAAHPGEAPITEYNLMSFFSDITEIVLRNPQFAV